MSELVENLKSLLDLEQQLKQVLLSESLNKPLGKGHALLILPNSLISSKSCIPQH